MSFDNFANSTFLFSLLIFQLLIIATKSNWSRWQSTYESNLMYSFDIMSFLLASVSLSHIFHTAEISSDETEGWILKVLCLSGTYKNQVLIWCVDIFVLQSLNAVKPHSSLNNFSDREIRKIKLPSCGEYL